MSSRTTDLQDHGPSTPARDWKQDFLASIVVFLVALPLCMGISIASGVPVAAGLVTGIVGGLIVGSLAGSPLQVSGPAAGLTVIIYDLVTRHGLEMLGFAVLLAGLLQFTAGILRVGQWFRAVSPAVIKGMLAGIGILILASQFHVMVDDDPKGSGLENLATIPQAIVKGLPLPELAPREERELRAEKLRALGTLHDDQLRLQEEVGEIVPEQASPEQIRQRADQLAVLAERQRELHERLQRTIGELENTGLMAAGPQPRRSTAASTVSMPETSGADGGEQSSRLQEAAAAALASTEAAAAVLSDPSVERIRASQEQAERAVVGVMNALKSHDWAAKLGLATIVLIVLWKALAPASLKLVPAPLVAIVLVTAAAAALAVPVLYVEVPNNLMDDLHLPSLTVLSGMDWTALAQAALVVAIVASAETLLCATAVDQLHNGARTKYDRELCAQGIGNSICGLLGGLPMTGVIVRSATNVQAGATSRMSSILHGMWLLVFVLLLTPVIRLIPTAALAAMLVYTGYKLVDPKSIKELWKYGKGEVVIYAATVATIVAGDLLKGVILGIVLSAVKLLWTISRVRAELELQPGGERATLRLRGAATFLQLPAIAKALERVPRGAELTVDAHALSYIDHACLDLLQSWARQHESSGGNVQIDWDLLHARYRLVQQPASHSVPEPAFRAQPVRATGVAR